MIHEEIIKEKDYLLDFEIDESLRLQEFCNLNFSSNDTLELLKRIGLMYQFSGSKVIESFLSKLCSENISSLLKFEIVLSLLNYSELLENIDSKSDDKETVVTKTENNEKSNFNNKQANRQEKRVRHASNRSNQYKGYKSNK